jgi:hypothetical protein
LLHTRRLATLLLGVWLGSGIFIAWFSRHNRFSVEQTLNYASKPFQDEIEHLDKDRLRGLLRFHAEELNREYSLWWGRLQLLLGMVLAILLLFATNGNRLVMTLVTGMVAIVVVQHFVIAPQIVELGRGFDFLPLEQYQQEHAALRSYRGTSSVLEWVKLVAGFALSVRLLISAGERKRIPKRTPATAVGALKR